MDPIIEYNLLFRRNGISHSGTTPDSGYVPRFERDDRRTVKIGKGQVPADPTGTAGTALLACYVEDSAMGKLTR